MRLQQTGLCWRMCVKNARDHIKRDAVLEMEDGPPTTVKESRTCDTRCSARDDICGNAITSIL